MKIATNANIRWSRVEGGHSSSMKDVPSNATIHSVNGHSFVSLCSVCKNPITSCDPFFKYHRNNGYHGSYVCTECIYTEEFKNKLCDDIKGYTPDERL